MRTISAKTVLSTRYKELDFTGAWADLMGRPEMRGSVIIYGASGNGKTRFALRFAKYLSGFAPVLYNSVEEGVSASMKMALMNEGLADVGARFRFADKASIADVDAWLGKARSPKIIFLDSVQMSDLSIQQYKDMVNKHRDRLFVWVSHEDDKSRRPLGALAKRIEYDAGIKIRVEGYRAMAKSRYGGGKPMDIWTEGATLYWGSGD